jgi:hypothetical protein
VLDGGTHILFAATAKAPSEKNVPPGLNLP